MGKMTRKIKKSANKQSQSNNKVFTAEDIQKAFMSGMKEGEKRTQIILMQSIKQRILTQLVNTKGFGHKTAEKVVEALELDNLEG